MPKRKLEPAPETFGRRLARLRKAAGYSQRALAAELGISQRMVAYYESQTEHPPTHLLPSLADALSLTTDQLLRPVIRLISVLTQFLNPEPPDVPVRVLAFIVPAHPDSGLRRRAHQGNGLRHHVVILLGIPGDAELGLDAEENQW